MKSISISISISISLSLTSLTSIEAFLPSTHSMGKGPFLTPSTISSKDTSISSSSPSSPSSSTSLFQSADSETATRVSFIDTELRGAAMKLHTKSQAPKEGQVEDIPPPNAKPHEPTHDDYIHYLVNQKYIYQLWEEDILVREELKDVLGDFVETGLERTSALEKDIGFLMEEYNLSRPDPGTSGLNYGKVLMQIASKGKEGVPELMCHYYNHYFAHTAGGRMIGKQLSAKLLDKKTLEFYKWDGDLNTIKSKVKDSIEALAATWTQEQKDECSGATAACFQGGGSLNSYLGGQR